MSLLPQTVNGKGFSLEVVTDWVIFNQKTFVNIGFNGKLKNIDKKKIINKT